MFQSTGANAMLKNQRESVTFDYWQKSNCLCKGAGNAWASPNYLLFPAWKKASLLERYLSFTCSGKTSFLASLGCTRPTTAYLVISFCICSYTVHEIGSCRREMKAWKLNKFPPQNFTLLMWLFSTQRRNALPSQAELKLNDPASLNRKLRK